MIVRIKLQVGPKVRPQGNLESKLLLAFSSLLTPGAVLSFAVALWRLLADLNVTEEFAIRKGLLSHWQVWLALGIAIQSLSITLDRYGRKLDRQGQA